MNLNVTQLFLKEMNMFKGAILFIYNILEHAALLCLTIYAVVAILFWDYNPIHWGEHSLVICRIYILACIVISISFNHYKLIVKYWEHFENTILIPTPPDNKHSYGTNCVKLNRLKLYIKNEHIFYFKDNVLCKFLYGYGLFCSMIISTYFAISFLAWDFTFWNVGNYMLVIMRILCILYAAISSFIVYAYFDEKVEETFFICVDDCVNEKDFDSSNEDTCYAYNLIKKEMMGNIKFVFKLFDLYHNPKTKVLGIEM